MDELKEKIAGEITLSESPGSAMKKWRELFGVTQIELSKQIRISTSTISDYESNRRLSPGVGVIKRFVDALMTIDTSRGGTVISGLNKFTNQEQQKTPFYLIHDFSAPISGVDFNRIIEGKVVANPNYLDSVKLF
ncbi:MAG: helix-turn-helix domain-containing protein, partial [Candidatus Micrarchaeota archaeon]|nr:helix-turn-helix domain-containing protein [Candidatus Micrarchaeota archaeon]